MSVIPTGTVTFLFTDIEGSTKLAQKYPERWDALRKRHEDILRSAVDAHNGYVFQIVGDEFCAAFHTPSDAIRSAVRSQIDLHEEKWSVDPIKVRMGIHTGQAEIQEDGAYHSYLSLSRVKRLMSAAHGGQVLVSLAAQELVRDDLPENVSLRDMGERRLKDLIRPEHVFQLVIANLPVDFPPLKTLDIYRHNLPTQLTTFIGREKEMAEIRQAITEHRLVTLTGAGGTGKTRLSLHVAADLLDHFPDGVWFVELAPLTDPGLIPSTILSAFGISEQPGLTSLQSLIDYLRKRKLLLVLDNCEHLVAETAKLVMTLLTSAEDLKILATSREALGITGEINWYVPSLSLPDIKHIPAIEELSQYEAVNLFIDRAILAQPHFTVTRDNAPSIAQICCRLDGIPLAIELAAARIKVLDVDQISRRLEDRFRLLTGGSRTSLPRHQTLRATIDWSYDLLSDQEKVLFRRLAVFVGGWTLEAAEQVCVMEEGGLDVFDLLAHLVDKSLVIMDSTAGEARYHMLETTRQYAGEKLTASGEAKVIRGRHSDWCCGLAEHFYKEMYSPNVMFWTRRLAVELENLRTALEWLFGDGNAKARGSKLVSDLADFFSVNGYLKELLFWLEKAVQETHGEKQSPVRANILLYYSIYIMSIKKGKWEDSRRMLVESLEILRDLGETHRMKYAYVLNMLGYQMYFRGNDHETGLTYLQEARAIFQDLDNKQGQGMVLRALSLVKIYDGDVPAAFAMAKEGAELLRACGNQLDYAVFVFIMGRCNMKQGNYQEAKRCFKETLDMSRKYGLKAGLTTEALQDLGETYRCLDEYAEAEACYRESLALNQEAGAGSSTFIADNLNLGYAVLYRGDRKQAVSFFKEALALSKEQENKEQLVWCLAGFAAVAAAQGDAENSTLLYGAVESLVQTLLAEGTRLESLFPPSDRRELDRYQGLCRAQLGDSAFESTLERGHTITLDAALAFALERVDR